jgi:phosphoenolpyruvate synthase/pyruvate phosphate dikinase
MTPLGSAHDENRYGGKAAGLARLLTWGYDVPPGVAFAWDETEAIARGDTKPADLDLPQPWAVRSSAVGEDAAATSFAGQHLTITGVQPSGLTAAIADVHASGAAVGAALYRRLRGVPGPIRMGAVVQQYIKADISVLAFGVHPVTREPGVVIEAAPGAGEHLVQGAITPDFWQLEPGGAILEHRTGEHPTQLEDVTVRAIATLVEEVSRRAGTPQDMELAIVAQRLHILQARPVSSP